MPMRKPAPPWRWIDSCGLWAARPIAANRCLAAMLGLVLTSAQLVTARAATPQGGTVHDQSGLPPPAPHGQAQTNTKQSDTNYSATPMSPDVRTLVNWVGASGDNKALPFVVVDKVNAKVFVFDQHSKLKGASPALLGLGRGDDSVPGIGQRRLATISAAERTTPAGRFQAALGHDFEQDILWIDYDTALSLHRVIVGNPKDHRAMRLASPSVLDNRISFGCINVPAAFYDDVVAPAFTGTVGIVYILPETKPLRAVFAIPEPQTYLAKTGGSNAPSAH